MTCRSYPLTAAEHDRWKLEGKTEWPGAVLPLHLLFPEREPAALQAIPTETAFGRSALVQNQTCMEPGILTPAAIASNSFRRRERDPRKIHNFFTVGLNLEGRIWAIE